MTVAIRKLSVPREHRLISQGQTVVIIATIEDVGESAVLLDPTYIPMISVFDPLGVQLVTDVVMTQLSTGTYIYNFISSAANPLGIYTVNVTAIHVNLSGQSNAARLERVMAFKIVKATTLTAFTYFAIKDQSGVTWYWYIAADNTLASLLTVPSILGKQAVSINWSIVPSWLQVNNPTPAVRYIYPDITGVATVSATQPVSGSGNVGSPVVTGVSGGNYTIGLNISDTIILNTV